MVKFRLAWSGFFLVLVSVTMSTDLQLIKDFCEKILGQTQKDTANCFNKPNSYTVERGNKPILIYLCCFNYFSDCTFDYMPYLSENFLDFFCQQTSEKYLLSAAHFVQDCKQNDYLLTSADFLHYLNSSNPQACRA